MVDAAWNAVELGMKHVQGKGIVNSISLKEGEASFLHVGAEHPALSIGVAGYRFLHHVLKKPPCPWVCSF